MGLRVWWDQFELKVGDSLIEKITLGLSRSRYGVVVLSRDFLAKPWPQYELQGLTARDIVGDKVILPIWYDIGFDEMVRVNPPLAQKKSIGIGRPYERRDLVGACLELLEVVRPDILTRLHRRVAHETFLRNARRENVPTSSLRHFVTSFAGIAATRSTSRRVDPAHPTGSGGAAVGVSANDAFLDAWIPSRCASKYRGCPMGTGRSRLPGVFAVQDIRRRIPPGRGPLPSVS
jgi:hypothetical protein